MPAAAARLQRAISKRKGAEGAAARAARIALAQQRRQRARARRVARLLYAQVGAAIEPGAGDAQARAHRSRGRGRPRQQTGECLQRAKEAWAHPRRRPVVAARAARAVGLVVEGDPAAPRHHAVVVVAAPHLRHQLQLVLEARQVRERVVVRLADPSRAQVARGVQPPAERLLRDRVRQVVARRHEDHVAVRSLLVPDGLALPIAHVVAAAQHKEHPHAALASLAHPQLLAHPDASVEVAGRRDHPKCELQRLQIWRWWRRRKQGERRAGVAWAPRQCAQEHDEEGDGGEQCR